MILPTRYDRAWTASWVVTKDKEDPRRRLLLPLKTNLAPDTTGLAYAVVGSPEDPSIGVIAWEPDPVTISADEALVAEYADPEERTARQEAAEWLREALSGGPVAMKDIQRMAKDSGHAWRTVQRAKTALRVASQHQGYGQGSTWYWDLPESLPSRDRKACHAGCSGDVATFERGGGLRADGLENTDSDGSSRSSGPKERQLQGADTFGAQWGTDVSPDDGTADPVEAAFRRRAAVIMAEVGFIDLVEAERLALIEEGLGL